MPDISTYDIDPYDQPSEDDSDDVFVVGKSHYVAKAGKGNTQTLLTNITKTISIKLNGASISDGLGARAQALTTASAHMTQTMTRTHILILRQQAPPGQ